MRAAAVVILLAVVVFVGAFGAFGARPAEAFEDYEGTRALSLGGATRAWALGDSALLLNPSGMPLSKSYNVEGAYAYGTRLSEQFIHASVVDSTSASNLAGGLYYTYHLAEPRGLAGRGHEVGGALALPVGPSVAIGATLKWFHLEGSDADPIAPAAGAAEARWTGFTTDVGATVRPTESFSLAVVGVNLIDHQHGQVPRMLTYGAAYLPVPEILVTLDGVTTFTRDDYTGAKGTGGRAGFEASLAQRVALRLGGGIDPVVGDGYLTGGLSVLSEVGAIDVGARGDLFPYRTGSTRNVFVGVSVRLFVTGALATAQATSP